MKKLQSLVCMLVLLGVHFVHGMRSPNNKEQILLSSIRYYDGESMLMVEHIDHNGTSEYYRMVGKNNFAFNNREKFLTKNIIDYDKKSGVMHSNDTNFNKTVSSLQDKSQFQKLENNVAQNLIATKRLFLPDLYEEKVPESYLNAVRLRNERQLFVQYHNGKNIKFSFMLKDTTNAYEKIMKLAENAKNKSGFYEFLIRKKYGSSTKKEGSTQKPSSITITNVISNMSSEDYKSLLATIYRDCTFAINKQKQNQFISSCLRMTKEINQIEETIQKEQLAQLLSIARNSTSIVRGSTLNSDDVERLLLADDSSNVETPAIEEAEQLVSIARDSTSIVRGPTPNSLYNTDDKVQLLNNDPSNVETPTVEEEEKQQPTDKPVSVPTNSTTEPTPIKEFITLQKNGNGTYKATCYVRKNETLITEKNSKEISQDQAKQLNIKTLPKDNNQLVIMVPSNQVVGERKIKSDDEVGTISAYLLSKGNNKETEAVKINDIKFVQLTNLVENNELPLRNEVPDKKGFLKRLFAKLFTKKRLLVAGGVVAAFAGICYLYSKYIRGEVLQTSLH